MPEQRLKITRAQLAKFLPDAAAIRAFEALFLTAEETTPTAIESVEIAAANAESMAIQALGEISRLADSIDGPWTSITVDFGSNPVSDSTFVISDANCKTGSVLEFTIIGGSSTSTNDQNSHAQAALLFSFAATPLDGQFSLDVGTMFGMVTGEFEIKYKVRK